MGDECPICDMVVLRKCARQSVVAGSGGECADQSCAGGTDGLAGEEELVSARSWSGSTCCSGSRSVPCSSIQKVAPPPGVGCTPIAPRCCWTMVAAIDRPRPAPPPWLAERTREE